MIVYIERTKMTEEFEFKGTAKELLLKLDINIQEVLVVRNKELVNEDTILKGSDEIKILSVISGG